MSEENVSIRKVNIIVSILFVVILGVSVVLQINVNKKNAIMACDIAMDQAEAVIKAYGSQGEGIEAFIDKMPYTDTVTTYLLDSENADDTLIYTEKEPGKRYYGVTDIEGPKSYMVSEVVEDYKVAVTYPVKEANANIGMMTGILVAALFCAFVIINIVVTRTFRVLEKSKAELEDTNAIVANAGFGTWYITLEEGKKPRMNANPKMKEVLGIEGQNLSEEETYEFWYSRIPEDAIPSVRASVQEMIEGKVSENTYQWEHPENGMIYVRCGGTGYKNDKKVQVLGGYHSDVTEIVLEDQNRQKELKAAKEEAERANAAKTSFLSRMSHDIRTPLNGILGLLKIDEKHEEDLELLKRNREKIKIAANHLLGLINDVLQMSKLEDGRIELAHEAIDLKKLANDVLTITNMRAAESGLTLNYQDSGEELRYPYVYGSPVHLRQLFVNIYSNAIKYNKIGGSIDTKFRFMSKENNIVTYQWIISDTGIGMSQEFMKHIFEPFAQERSDARSIYKGTGLGMSIVKSLVDKMNGSIEVTSEEGKGSIFTITLPFEIAEKSEISEKKEFIRNADITGLKLLLAEDNDLNAEIAQVQLEEAGASVTLVKDGKQAVEMFAGTAHNTFDAILMDIMMPVMDGLTATRTIRAMERPDAATIPIIAMSANAFTEDAKKSIDAGMNAHLAKPLKMERVVATIARYCGKNEEPDF